MTIPLWLQYVDDTFTALHKDEIDAFHDHLNEKNADIQFTKEIEENGKLPFLDCLVSRDNNELRSTVYRKPMHTDSILDESSYNPTSHKATTIKTLTRRAQLVRNTPDSLFDENNNMNVVFSRSTTTLTKEESKSTNDWWQESSSQYWHHGSTDQSLSTDQTFNIIDWETLFTWLWRWLPLRLSKRQVTNNTSFQNYPTRTITQYKLLKFTKKWKTI